MSIYLIWVLQYIFAVSLPEAQPASKTVVDSVARAHAPVEGRLDGGWYSAADPETQRWVTATLYWTANQVRWRIWGANNLDEAEQIYQSYAVLGTALGMPDVYWPSDRAAFQRYWAEQVARLEVTDAARQIMADLFAAESAPPWLRVVMPLAKFLTAGLLPPQIRLQLGMDWDGRDSMREDRLWRVLRTVYPRLPDIIRHAPAKLVVSGLT